MRGGGGGWVGGGWGGGQKFLLDRLQAVGTHGACNTASGPMVTQPIPHVGASVRTLLCLLLARPPAAAPKWADWVSNRRPHGCQRLRYHSATTWLRRRPPCCLGPHLPLTKNPNCVYLSDCLLAGSGTDWLTVNLSSRCTAEGNRILSLWLELQFWQSPKWVCGNGVCCGMWGMWTLYHQDTP